ncbi:MAG TPA: hypothetical protein VEL70_07840 [Candidatus Acidoferrum sp.]|nr:hypothetical protein [Candidatus Acidoferrum sp.]
MFATSMIANNISFKYIALYSVNHPKTIRSILRFYILRFPGDIHQTDIAIADGIFVGVWVRI